ncbi:MAG: ferritin-like domain-containing protein [Thermotaleaceae bacterium]
MQYYGPYPYGNEYMRPPMPNHPPMLPQDPYTYPHNLPLALQAMKEAVEGEREKSQFYDYLISSAPSEDQTIIKKIKDTEAKHYIFIKQIYRELTGQVLSPLQEKPFMKPRSYCDGLKRAVLAQLEAIKNHRKILFALQDRRHINMLTEIITDELMHGDLFNLLYSKNECYEEEKEKKY